MTAVSQKAEIQYVSQFCGYGSDEPKKKKKKKVEKKPQKIHVFHLDPVALCGIFSAVILAGALIFGGIHLHIMWKDHVAVKEYLGQLKTQNAKLQHDFSASYNLDDIKTMSDSLGLQPETDMETRYVRVTPPAPKPRRTWMDDVKWFFKGLFAHTAPGVPVE